jgi:ribosomal protein S18 acetylase RimI-like enzyme
MEKLFKMDLDTPGEPWLKSHFLLELPGKWELSQIGFQNSTIIGFCIASRKGNTAHIHRFVVAKEFRSRGYGEKLINYFASVVKKYALNSITLKVANTNNRAIDFYLQHNFKVFKEDEINKSLILAL